LPVAHHLYLVVDDWAGDPFCFCKPVAKTPEDRIALLKAVVSGNPKFFLGTDSAPHPMLSKTCGADRRAKVAAGVFTQPYATQYVLGALEKAVDEGVLQDSDITEKKLRDFLSVFGRSFYAILPLASHEKIRLTKGENTVMDLLRHEKGEVEVVPFRSGQKTWTLTWV
jgi:dihydroorotase